MRLRWLLPCLLSLGLVACDRTQGVRYYGSQIMDQPIGGKLDLSDHNGRSVSLKTFEGKLAVLAFGYTHCPDVCPTTLADLAAAFKSMSEAEVAKVQVLFVTLDPERDTPEVLKAYVPYFHSSFLGLHGSQERIVEATRAFKVVYRKHVEAGATGYLVDHTAGSFVLDARARPRLFFPYGHKPDEIAHDLKTLISAGAA